MDKDAEEVGVYSKWEEKRCGRKVTTHAFGQAATGWEVGAWKGERRKLSKYTRRLAAAEWWGTDVGRKE